MKSVFLLSKLNDHELVVVEDAWDGGVITKSAADYTVIVVYAGGVLGEDSLPRREDTASEDPPLTAVCMTAHNEIHSDL